MESLDLAEVKEDKEQGYRIGYSKKLKKYIMECTITDWIIDYTRYYSLTAKEFTGTVEELKELKQELISDTSSEKFLFSMKKSENTVDRTELLHSIIGGGKEDE